jgi:hypothetical protein
VFPNLWKGVLSNTEQFFAQLVVGEDEIYEAFTLLVSVEKPVENHCFCFFIDGLDEYRTTPEYDYNDLVLSLRNWTSNMPSNVKMCVSSREYPAFMRGFLPSQRFRLHQITKYDMIAYTRDRLESVADADSVAFLTSRIVEKACGIFFWLALVVKDVREQLASQVALADLLEILNNLPSEMNDLYRKILEMLSTYNRKRAYQTLSMLQFVAGQRLLDLEAYSFLNDYNSDPEFARRAPMLLPRRDDAQGRRQRAQNWLSEWCRGLVEASERGHLDYAHRSVADFFRTENMRNEMDHCLGGQHPIGIVSELVLAQFKVMKPDESDFNDSLGQLNLVHDNHSLDFDRFAFLISASEASEDVWVHMANPSAIYNPFPSTSHTGVIRKIANDLTMTNTPYKVALLFYTAISRPAVYPVVDALFEQGCVTSPRTRVRPLPLPEFWMFRFSLSLFGGGNAGFTVWKCFFIHYFYHWLIYKSIDGVYGCFGHVVERFLRSGEDIRVRFETVPPESGETRDYFYFGDPDHPEVVVIRRVIRRRSNFGERTHKDTDTISDIPDEMLFGTMFPKLLAWPLVRKKATLEVTLRGLIEATEKCPNKDVLLQLLDSSISNLEANRGETSTESSHA